MMAPSKTEDYQLLGEVLDQGLKELGYSREDLRVELFASDKQHVLDLYCRKEKNCGYKLYWPSFGMAYGNPRFSELGKVLTRMALERSRMVLCSPDWGAHGGNEYWRNLLDRLTISSVRSPDEAIYVPLGRKTPIQKPGWGSMLSVVDGGLTSIPWEDLDPTLLQAIQRESDGLALGDLKDRLPPQDAIETTPGGDEYVVTNTNAPNSPCHVPVPDGVSECGLSELPSSIHSDDETEHDAFFVKTCVEELDNAEYVAQLKPLLSMRVEEGPMPRTCWACDPEAPTTPWPVLHLIAHHHTHPTTHLPPQAYAWVAPWFHRTDTIPPVAWNPYHAPKWLLTTTPT